MSADAAVVPDSPASLSLPAMGSVVGFADPDGISVVLYANATPESEGPIGAEPLPPWT